MFANEHNSGTGGLTVTDTATASVKAGCRPGGGAVTVDSGATLEVAESGTVALGGSLTLNADASLGFNFTEWATAPKLAVPGAVTANGAVVVRISADEGMRPAHGTGGKFVLTSGGKFNGVTVSLDETNKPYWVKGVSVENGEIVLSVRSAGLIYVE